jgi:hypothetical protein
VIFRGIAALEKLEQRDSKGGQSTQSGARTLVEYRTGGVLCWGRSDYYGRISGHLYCRSIMLFWRPLKNSRREEESREDEEESTLEEDTARQQDRSIRGFHLVRLQEIFSALDVGCRNQCKLVFYHLFDPAMLVSGVEVILDPMILLQELALR